MLFYIDEKELTVLHPDAVKLCPELGVLSDKEVAFIVLAYDYKSPFRQYPERQREQQAMWKVFGMDQPNLLTKHSIVVAKEKYISLQYDPKITLVATFYKKIDSLSRSMEAEESPSKLKNIIENIDTLKSMITKYENEIDADVQKKGVIKGGASLSWLEEAQKNMKKYAHDMQNKPAAVK